MTTLSRRRVLQSLAAIGAAGPMLNAAASAAGPKRFFRRHGAPVGIQLYTLGELTRTDLSGTLKAIAKTGYKTVELAGYLGKTPKDLRTAFDAAGLSCSSAHVRMRTGAKAEPGLLEDIDQLVADMHTLGATDVIAPSLAKPDDMTLEAKPEEGGRVLARIAAAMTEDQWKRMAGQLNDVGKRLKAGGLGFGYHNHNMEFVKVGNRSGFEILLAETDPAFVTFELDVGWVAAAGLDPATVFEQHAGRFRLMHIKDVKASTTPNLELRMDPTEVGSGRLNWTTILPAAYRAGVRKFFVEQEPPFEHGRLEAAAICYKYLSSLKA